MFLVGLTGGIATGKSTAAEVFRSRGVPVIDADEIARLVVQPGTKAYKRIRQAFGDEFFDDENGGELKRQQLGNFIFGNVEMRRKLNAITHPEISVEMLRRVVSYFIRGYRYVVLDVPLLFEGPLYKVVQKTVVVYCDEESQIQRLMLRDSLSESEARARIHAQMPIEEKKKRATHPVDNNGDIEETKKRIHSIIDEFEASWLPFFIRAFLIPIIMLPTSAFLFWYFV